MDNIYFVKFDKMFLDTIEYHIFSTLAQQKDLAVQQLYDKLKKNNIAQSLPWFYKVIKKLINDQTIIKKSGKLQLHSMYVNYLINLSGWLQQNYIEENMVDIENLKGGEQKIFYGSSLYELDLVRANIMWQLVIKYPNDESFNYNSHPYGTLAMPERDSVNLQELWKNVKKTYFLIGNSSFLDQYGANLLNLQWYEIKCISNTSFLDEWYCLNVIWDYIVDCIFPTTITEYFKIFFHTVDTPDKFNISLFKNIAKMKERRSMKLTYSPEHAKKLREKIRKYF